MYKRFSQLSSGEGLSAKQLAFINDSIGGLDSSFSYVLDLVDVESSTGLYEGGIVSLVDSSTVAITAGKGVIKTNEQVTNVEWDSFDTVSIPNISAHRFTHVYIDKTSQVVLSNVSPTPITRRTHIYLAKVVHSGSSLVIAFPQPQYLPNGINGIHDYFESIANFIVIRGGTVSTNSNELTLNVEGATLYGIGINYVNNPLNPNMVTLSDQQTPSFSYRVVNNGVTTTNEINPTLYENPVGTLAPVPNNKYTNQRIFLFPSGNLAVQYGQHMYDKLTNAIDAIPTESFVYEKNIEDNATMLAILTVKQSCTDLTEETECVLSQADQFGRIGNGGAIGGGTGITNLQTAYNFNEIGEIILTDNKPFGIRDVSNQSQWKVFQDGSVTIHRDTSTNFLGNNVHIQQSALLAGQGDLSSGVVALFPYDELNGTTASFGSKHRHEGLQGHEGGALLGTGVQSAQSMFSSIHPLSFPRSCIHLSSDLEWWTGSHGAIPLHTEIPKMTRKFHVSSLGNLYTQGNMNRIAHDKESTFHTPLVYYSVHTYEDISNMSQSTVYSTDSLFSKLSTIQTIHYETPSHKSYGVDVSSLSSAFPSLVSTVQETSLTGTPQTMQAVDYQGLVSVLLEAITSLRTDVESMKALLKTNNGATTFTIPTQTVYTSSYQELSDNTIESLVSVDITAEIKDMTTDPSDNEYYFVQIAYNGNGALIHPNINVRYAISSLIVKMKATNENDSLYEVDTSFGNSGILLFEDLSTRSTTSTVGQTIYLDVEYQGQKILYEPVRNFLYVIGRSRVLEYQYDGGTTYTQLTNSLTASTLFLGCVTPQGVFHDAFYPVFKSIGTLSSDGQYITHSDGRTYLCFEPGVYQLNAYRPAFEDPLDMVIL